MGSSHAVSEGPVCKFWYFHTRWIGIGVPKFGEMVAKVNGLEGLSTCGVKDSAARNMCWQVILKPVWCCYVYAFLSGSPFLHFWDTTNLEGKKGNKHKDLKQILIYIFFCNALYWFYNWFAKCSFCLHFKVQNAKQINSALKHKLDGGIEEFKPAEVKQKAYVLHIILSSLSFYWNCKFIFAAQKSKEMHGCIACTSFIWVYAELPNI